MDFKAEIQIKDDPVLNAILTVDKLGDHEIWIFKINTLKSYWVILKAIWVWITLKCYEQEKH